MTTEIQNHSPNHNHRHTHNIPMDTVDKNHDESMAENESDDCVMSSWLTADEDTAAELSKLLKSLDSEPAPPPVKVRFIENPYSPPVVVVQTSAGYVTIDGNEESCGSSFSETESFMASIDLCGVMKFVEVGEEARGDDAGEVDVDWNWSQFLLDESDFGGGCNGGGDATWMEAFGGEEKRKMEIGTSSSYLGF